MPMYDKEGISALLLPLLLFLCKEKGNKCSFILFYGHENVVMR